MGVSEIPSRLKAHSEGLASGKKVDVVGDACEEDAVALVLEDADGKPPEALTSNTSAPDGTRPEGVVGVALPCPTTAPDGNRPEGRGPGLATASRGEDGEQLEDTEIDLREDEHAGWLPPHFSFLRG